MKSTLIYLFLVIVFAFQANAQQYQLCTELQMHGQILKTSQKNNEKFGEYAYMSTKEPFSFAAGPGFSMAIQSQNDSSNLIWKVGLQQIWGNVIQVGSFADSITQGFELWQSAQTNLNFGIGFNSKGKYPISFFIGPVIPLRYKTTNTFDYQDNNYIFTAYQKVKFSKSIGIASNVKYHFKINSRVNLAVGLNAQILKRNILSNAIEKVTYTKGDAIASGYALTKYQQNQEFVSEITTDINDATLNPTGYDANKARQLLTQNYSFSSLSFQFGFIYQL